MLVRIRGGGWGWGEGRVEINRKEKNGKRNRGIKFQERKRNEFFQIMWAHFRKNKVEESKKEKQRKKKKCGWKKSHCSTNANRALLLDVAQRLCTCFAKRKGNTCTGIVVITIVGFLHVLSNDFCLPQLVTFSKLSFKVFNILNISFLSLLHIHHQDC